MKTNTFNALLLLTLSSYIYAEDEQQFTKEFKRYPVQVAEVKAKPLILDKNSRKYRTLLKEMTTEPYNLSGHFVASTYGCGGGCTGLLVYNGKTGRGLLMKEQFQDCYTEKHGFTQNNIFFEKNSRLIIAVGTRTGQLHQCEEVHYLIDKDQFKQIKAKYIYQ